MEKKLKIAFLCRDYGTIHRGVETYVTELSKRLEKNYQVEILTGKNAYSFFKIIKGNFDLVIPTNGRTQALKASIGRIFGRYKLIISGQSGIGRDDIFNIAITMPDVFVAITELEKRWAKKWAWKSNIIKISNGVDLDKFSLKGEKVDFNLERPIILSVGALDWYKHHERSIQALKLLGKGSLVIIGKGPKKDELIQLAKNLNLTDKVKFIQVPFSEIPAYYRSADLFVLPSWDRESFGIVYLEAMASGISVVAPNDLSRQEIVQDAGILIDVSNIEKYAEAITEALNKSWKNLPRQQAEKFSWDKIVDQYENLFKEMF